MVETFGYFGIYSSHFFVKKACLFVYKLYVDESKNHKHLNYVVLFYRSDFDVFVTKNNSLFLAKTYQNNLSKLY